MGTPASRRLPRRWSAVLMLACIIPGLASGCADEGSGGSTSSEPAPSPSAFSRLGYELAVPDGWQAQEGMVDWVPGLHVPGRGHPAVDSFAPPELDPWFVITARHVAGNPSLDAWIQAAIEDDSITFTPEFCPNTPADTRATTLGGEPAQLRGFVCAAEGPTAIAVQVLARHADDAWFVMCASPSALEGDLAELEEQCEEWLESFAYLD